MNTIKEQSAFELKGGMITVPVLHLKSTDFTLFDAQLKAIIAQSPKLFESSPLIIDLESIASQESIDFPRLVRALRSHAIIPVGIKHGSPEQKHAAKNAGLGFIASSSAATKSSPTKTANKKTLETAMIINKPVRSGQQIYAKNKDLIVLGSVSSAAEVMADGNILIYGTLNGKALAGVSGKTDAKILCSLLRADLVAIAGHYKCRDEMEDHAIPQSPMGTQVFLDKQHLCIQKI